ncbi:MAG TPA: hemerythrin domain-containing protein [Thermoanaerobaculia bacterium]
MKITDALRGEHGVLLRMLEFVAGEARGASLGDAQAMGRLLRQAIESHAQLEDELLFCALEPSLPAQQGPLAVMRMEHAEIEGSLERLARETAAEGAGALLLHLAEVARDHFAKEEQVLFPLAERVLPAERLVEIGTTWAERRAVLVG